MNDVRDYRIDQIYIHAIKLNHKLMYSREGDQTIVWAYDPKYYPASVENPENVRGSSVWVRFK